MAVIFRGKHKTKEVRIRQFCNDWISVEHPDIPPQESIINPLSLSFSEQERERIQNAAAAGKTGYMFQKYYWDGLVLKKKKYFG